MATRLISIIDPILLGTASTNHYTASNAEVVIDKMTLTNNSTQANIVVNIHIVPTGGSADSSNVKIATRSIAPLQTYRCPEMVGQYLMSGWSIVTTCNTADLLNIGASGRELT